MLKSYKNYIKIFWRPKKSFEKERLEEELNSVGKYGLKKKSEAPLTWLWKRRIHNRKMQSLSRNLNREIWRSQNIFQLNQMNYPQMDKIGGNPTSKDTWITHWGDGLRAGTEKLPPWFNFRLSYFIYISLIIIILLFLFLNTYLYIYNI